MTEIRHLSEAPTGRRPLAPGAGIDAHRHDTHQIVYACRGVLSVTTGAGTWVAPANRAIWIPAGTVHEHRAHGDTDLRLVGLTDNPLGLDRPAVLAVGPLLRELIIAYTADDDRTPAPPPHPATAPPAPRGTAAPAVPEGTGTSPSRFAEFPQAPPAPSAFDTDPALRDPAAHAHAHATDACHGGDERGSDERGSDEDARRGARRGHGAGDGDDDGDGDGERARLWAVLLDQLRRAPEQPLHLPTAQDPRLAAVCATLHRDPADSRTLAQLAAGVGTSDRTLARLCRRELGMSFPQWRTQLRLHHALLLLADGVPVTTVAHRCGWASASAFIDVFRRAFGYTPGRAFTL
ncbi:helix-turn-helix transcriptional regulator [Nonomuraea sp. NPDC050786]|uniref:AraC family transcriptional regulator n=1 Tax=Nonomuraea sp. NPDC050786 TaxID=3154840 RepID=UPI00340FCDB6